jgi:hypothetical protein
MYDRLEHTPCLMISARDAPMLTSEPLFPLTTDGPLLGSIGDGAASSRPQTEREPAGAVGSHSTPSQPQRAANPLIQVQEPTPRQPVLSRFGSAESFPGDGSPARKSSPAATAPPTASASPLGVLQPERDTSWELDSDDEASAAAVEQKEEVRPKAVSS